MAGLIVVLPILEGGLETIYLIISISLTLANIVIPSLAAILVDSLLLIPCYVVGAVILGLFTDYGYLGDEVGSCSYVTPADCRMAWHVFGALQILGTILQFLGLVLTIIDLVRVIRIRRTEIRLKKKAHV
ncbi:hypothetical protein C8J57DRAFT_1492265 [Mycena rebaudengoi]|nr:hypothetical protein C8J57DRAFT_1492265 [Mycena rebaudengoi]